MEKLKENFFARDSKTIAKDLLGRKLIRLVGNKKLEGIITETGAFYGKSRRIVSQGIEYAAGKIYIMSYRGKRFLNIATDKKGVASCVWIRKLTSETDTYGPGKLTKVFQLENFDGMSVYGKEFWIEGEAFSKIREKKDKIPSNCLGYYEIFDK